MNPAPMSSERRKAVWATRLAAGLALTFLFGTSAFAEGPHRRPASKLRPGAANSQAYRGKLDKELTHRATRGGTTKVIVTLKDGATLPAEFARYAKAHGRLNLINGHVLNVPNNVLK